MSDDHPPELLPETGPKLVRTHLKTSSLIESETIRPFRDVLQTDRTGHREVSLPMNIYICETK